MSVFGGPDASLISQLSTIPSDLSLLTSQRVHVGHLPFLHLLAAFRFLKKPCLPSSSGTAQSLSADNTTMSNLRPLLGPVKAVTLHGCNNDLDAYIDNFTKTFHCLFVTHTFSESQREWLEVKAGAVFVKNLGHRIATQLNLIGPDSVTGLSDGLSVVVEGVRDARPLLKQTRKRRPSVVRHRRRRQLAVQREFFERLQRVTLSSHNYNLSLYIEAFRYATADLHDRILNLGENQVLDIDYSAIFRHFLRQMDDECLECVKAVEAKELLTWPKDDREGCARLMAALNRIDRTAEARSLNDSLR